MTWLTHWPNKPNWPDDLVMPNRPDDLNVSNDLAKSGRPIDINLLGVPDDTLESIWQPSGAKLGQWPRRAELGRVVSGQVDELDKHDR